jgi:hypothetical protein
MATAGVVPGKIWDSGARLKSAWLIERRAPYGRIGIE